MPTSSKSSGRSSSSKNNYLEADLVDEFKKALAKEWSERNVRIGLEFPYHSGRLDIVASVDDGSVVAFEAKLVKWREAMRQAFRSSYFANYVYVVLPERTARSAAQHIDYFEKHGVGIVAVSGGEIEFLFDPIRREPLQPYMHEAARAFAGSA